MVSNPLTHLTHPTTTQMQVIISIQQQNNHLFNNHMQKTNTPIIQKQNLFPKGIYNLYSKFTKPTSIEV
jgi:hypothetical protein